MPRDGSNVYHYPVGIEGEPNQTIESPAYNSFLSDVEQDLNAPRPILAGGTGATSAEAALTNLGGEQAGQIVTNYDSYVFKAGSFSSAIGATNAPVAGQAFTGICYMADSNNFFVEARSLVDGKLYARGKVAGVWPPGWTNSDAALDAKKVNRAGDSMTGTLYLSMPPYGQSLVFNNTTGGGYNKTIRMGATSELEFVNSAFNATIMTLTDGGLLTANALASIGTLNVAGLSALGQANVTSLNASGNISANGITANDRVDITCAHGVTQLRLHNNTYGSKYFRVGVGANLEFINNAHTTIVASLTDSGLWTCNGVTANGTITASGTITAGSSIYTGSNFHLPSGNGLYFEGSNAVRLYWDGSSLKSSHQFYANSSIQSPYISSSGNVNADNQLTCGYLGVNVNSYTGSNPYQTNLIAGNPNWGHIQVMGLHYPGNWAGMRFNGGGISFDFRMSDSSAHKTSGAVTWVIDSDARIKTVHNKYTQGLDAIAALQPIVYSYKRNQSFDALEQTPELTDSEKENIKKFKLLRYVGLVAQEAEGAMPELFTREPAYIDGKKVEDMRTAEYTPLIFALVNAVKELKARVEELEAR